MEISAILCKSLHAKNDVILYGRKYRAPKDGVWGIIGSKLNKMIESGEIDAKKLTDYKKRKVNINYGRWPDNTEFDRIIRKTFTQDNGQIKYSQDLYPNGKLVTNIVKRKPNGELASCKKWIEYIA